MMISNLKSCVSKTIIVLATLILLSSCSSSKPNRTTGTTYKKEAIAVYYHDKFNGRLTASGDRFSNTKYTAAHKTLPFGTKLRVTNLETNKSVLVKVNDRGPFTKGREIDLSKKAFMEIATNKNQGILTVKIDIIP